MTTEKKQYDDFNFQTAHVVSYANIEKPKAFEKKGQPKGDPKYSALFIIDPECPDLVRLKEDVLKALKEQYPGKTLRARRLTEEELTAGTFVEVSVPWRSGDKEADRLKAKNNGDDSKGTIYRGKILVKASSKYQPALSIIEGGTVVDLETDEAKAKAGKYFYSGAYLVPSFRFNPFEGDENKPGGMSLYLNAVLFAKNGKRIGGRTVNAAEAFKGYVGTISQEDPTAGAGFNRDDLDDEIPF
jgi:hypothetical protein